MLSLPSCPLTPTLVSSTVAYKSAEAWWDLSRPIICSADSACKLATSVSIG